ncbi:MAG: polymerase sigma-70 factor [Akkermansiaceae bacterium]|nr:polymerase sigma-70 factor [Akkermansiaceae bacterium]
MAAGVTAPSHFPATQWTNLIKVCRSGNLQLREQALEILCRDYWQPLYAFARRSGVSPHDAEDLTQGFMSYLLERDLFSAADQGQGKLRTFLLVIFQRYMRDTAERLHAKKRGGDREIVTLSQGSGDTVTERDIADPVDPEVWFNRIWAQSLIDASVAALRAEEITAGRARIFETLEPFLNPEGISEANYGVAAYKLGLTEEAIRKAVSRLRKKFRDSLRSQIAATLSDPTEKEVDEELSALRAALQA